MDANIGGCLGGPYDSRFLGCDPARRIGIEPFDTRRRSGADRQRDLMLAGFAGFDVRPSIVIMKRRWQCRRLMFMRGEAVRVFGMLVAGIRVRVQTRKVTGRADDGDTDQ